MQLSVQEFSQYLGKELGVSSWVLVDQAWVDRFAQVGGDHQWIHTDPQRAKFETDFGGTVVHGYFILALTPQLMDQVFAMSGVSMGINRGFDKIRFISPLLVGDKLRLRVSLIEQNLQTAYCDVKYLLSFEGEGYSKPVCVAELIKRWHLSKLDAE